MYLSDEELFQRDNGPIGIVDQGLIQIERPTTKLNPKKKLAIESSVPDEPVAKGVFEVPNWEIPSLKVRTNKNTVIELQTIDNSKELFQVSNWELPPTKILLKPRKKSSILNTTPNIVECIKQISKKYKKNSK